MEYLQKRIISAFSKTQLPLELWRVLSCKSPAVFLHFPLEEKEPWDSFHQLQRMLAKRRHLLQIPLKALFIQTEAFHDYVGSCFVPC